MQKEGTKFKVLWDGSETLQDYAPLKGDETCDVCIVGAGISGLTAALTLAQEGLKVVLLEARTLGAGQTRRTTAHISDYVDYGYAPLISLHGLEKTRAVAKALSQAIAQIKRNINSGEDDCDFQTVNGYLFSGVLGENQVVQKEFTAMQKIAVQDVTLESGTTLLPSHGGVFMELKQQALFHPIKYLASLARQSDKLGARIYCHTRVLKIDEQADNVTIETDKNHKVTAKHVIVASNTPIHDRFTIHTKQAPYTTYAIAARIPHNAITPSLNWDCEDPFHYVRVHQFRDSDLNLTPPAYDYLILGGSDHKSGQGLESKDHLRDLRAWALNIFPDIILEFTHQWSGQFMMPVDRLPFCGRDPSEKGRVLLTTGYGGLGMTFSTVSAQVMRDIILQRDNKLIEILDPGRRTIASLPTYISENTNAFAQFGRYFSGMDQNLHNLPAEEATIIRDGIHRIAVYRDKNHEDHKFYAVCPHLGGPLQWNSFEKTWDCPLHGSKFTATGEVIVGPANCDLKQCQELTSKQRKLA